MGTGWSVAYAENPLRNGEVASQSDDGGGAPLDAATADSPLHHPAGAPPSRERGGRPVQTAIEIRLAELVADLSHWEPTSNLSRFNRAAAGSWHALSPDFAAVIAASLAIAETTGGAFDPAIGRVVDLLGFGPPGPQPEPDGATLEEARAAGGIARLAFDGHARRLRQPGGLALDLSGIAKGYAVDAIGQVLDGLGLTDWLVEIGGELKGSGMRPDADPWWVDAETPPGLEVAPLRIALHGLAIATSGDYARGPHTIDPRTGRSVAGGLRAVSVVHHSAMLADAWATALTVLGPDEGQALANAHGIAARLIVEREGQATEHLTAALRTMITD